MKEKEYNKNITIYQQLTIYIYDIYIDSMIERYIFITLSRACIISPNKIVDTSNDGLYVVWYILKEGRAKIYFDLDIRNLPDSINLILPRTEWEPLISKLNTSFAAIASAPPGSTHPLSLLSLVPFSRAEHMFFSSVQMHRTQPLRCVELQGVLYVASHECILHLLRRVRSHGDWCARIPVCIPALIIPELEEQK